MVALTSDPFVPVARSSPRLSRYALGPRQNTWERLANGVAARFSHTDIETCRSHHSCSRRRRRNRNRSRRHRPWRRTTDSPSPMGPATTATQPWDTVDATSSGTRAVLSCTTRAQSSVQAVPGRRGVYVATMPASTRNGHGHPTNHHLRHRMQYQLLQPVFHTAIPRCRRPAQRAFLPSPPCVCSLINSAQQRAKMMLDMLAPRDGRRSRVSVYR